MTVRVIHGDCRDVLRDIDSESIAAVVTDPPYGLEFMGKDWDKFKTGRAAKYSSGGTLRDPADRRGKGGAGPSYTKRPAKRCRICGKQSWSGSPCQCPIPQWEIDNSPLHAFQAFNESWAREVLRVLKPGAHLIAFGGTRTYHRLACAIEDAGFEIRDQIGWLYGSGFPKSHNAAVGIAKSINPDREAGVPMPAEAEAWNGWGTALKPAWEPIVLARKPLIGTVAANVQQHGTGAMNIDGCRVATAEDLNGGRYSDGKDESDGPIYGAGLNKRRAQDYAQPAGRWPANVIHDGSEEVVAAFPDGGPTSKPGTVFKRASAADRDGNSGTAFGSENRKEGEEMIAYGDSGSAARFFYTAKADARDRLGSRHPTVKPVDLMAYLCRLVTPPNGTVLDPFAGSGTTGMACLREGFDCILIEREAEYVADIHRRLDHVAGADTPLFAASNQ